MSTSASSNPSASGPSVPSVTKHTLLTERVERVARDITTGERQYIPGVRDPSLTPEEQAKLDELIRLLKEAAARGENLDNLDSGLWRMDYIKRPPGIREFLLNDYYLGNTWKYVPGENEGIWPEWLNLLETWLDLDSRVHNLVITGALGIGKTAMMVTILLYRVCVAAHLKNPQNFFGLSRNSNIVYNLLSITKEAVKDTAYGTAISFMGDSPFFREFCKFDPEMDYSGYRIPLRNLLPDGRISRLWLTAGSKGHHVLGRNLVGIGLDEGNFRLEKNPDLKAYELYDQVRTRITNRFQKLAGYLPAISIIASSALDESSFTERIVAEIEEANRLREKRNSQLPPNVLPEPVSQLVFRHAVYRIKRHALTGITKDHRWFKVAYGLKNTEPFILSGWYREDGTPIGDEPHEEPPPGARTELVPELYYAEYRRNCRAQLQNLSGISTGGAHRLFPSMVDIEECLALSEKEGVPNPLKPGVQRIPISSEDNLNIWDYLNHKAFLTRVHSKIQPLRNPERLRYAHIDLATQTLAGLAICHVAGRKNVEGLVKDGEPFSEYRLIVEYDFILTICAGQRQPINLGKIQKFFFWLRNVCGYRFGLITADMWQCLTGDTLVDTNHGTIPLAEVNENYLVQNAEGGIAKVIRLFKYPACPVIRLYTDMGETICGTPNHRLLSDKQWKYLADFKVGDVLDSPEVPVKVHGDLELPEALWLGVYWGTGNWRRQKNRVTVRLRKKYLPEILENFRKFKMDSWGTLEEREIDPDQVELILENKNFCKWLEANYPSGPGSKLTARIRKSNAAGLRQFVRGWLMVSGLIFEDGFPGLRLKSELAARQLQVLLKTRLGIFSKITVEHQNDNSPVYALVFLKMPESERLVLPFEATGAFRCFQAEPVVSRVTKIEYSNADVYDLEVSPEHSYTANGFVSHNSEMPLQELEAQGFEVGRLSLDRDKSVYYTWRAGFQEKRIRLHRNEQMLYEAEHLVEMDKKFDHPINGSKDTTDAAAGAYYNAVTSKEFGDYAGIAAPSVYKASEFEESQAAEKPIMEIGIPEHAKKPAVVFKI